jgi:hypothetical protein
MPLRPCLLLLLQVRSMHNILGGVIDAHASYLLLRGMKTLGLRVEHQNRCGCSSRCSSSCSKLSAARTEHSAAKSCG